MMFNLIMIPNLKKPDMKDNTIGVILVEGEEETTQAKNMLYTKEMTLQ